MKNSEKLKDTISEFFFTLSVALSFSIAFAFVMKQVGYPICGFLFWIGVIIVGVIFRWIRK